MSAKIKALARKLYSRDDIAEFIFNYIQYREAMAFTYTNKPLRPITPVSSEDIKQLGKDCHSFHATAEIFEKPLLEAPIEQNKVVAFDIVIDVDCKDTDGIPAYEISKYITKGLIEILSTLNIDEVYVKYSGNRGFHIIIPYTAIPYEVYSLPFKDIIKLKETVCYCIISFLRDIAADIYDSFTKEYEINKPFEEVVNIDLQVSAKRHMLRTPYSLNEKSGLVSVIVPIKYLEEFDPKRDATVDCNIEPIPKFKENVYIYDLVLLSMLAVLYDKNKENIEKYLEFEEKLKEIKESVKVSREKIRELIEKYGEEMFPPCIRNMLKGLEDGRKRALFNLVNFFRCLGYPPDKVYNILKEWNERNKEPLRERLIEYAIEYHYSRQRYLPYSCQRMKEELGELGICQPDEICSLCKNPLAYPYKKAKILLKDKNRNNTKQ